MATQIGATYLTSSNTGPVEEVSEPLERFKQALLKHLLAEKFDEAERMICDPKHSKFRSPEIFESVFVAILEDSTNPLRYSIASRLDSSLCRCTFLVSQRLDSTFSNLCRAACLIQLGEIQKASDEIAFLGNLHELEKAANHYRDHFHSTNASMAELFTIFLKSVAKISDFVSKELAKPSKLYAES